MLKWPVFCAGVIMSLAGAVWLVQGLDIIQVERGWSGVIAGSVLLGAGALLMAMAAALRELELLRLALSGPAAGASPDAVASNDMRADSRARDIAAPIAAPLATPADQSGADHWKTILARTNAPAGKPVEPGAARDGRLARRYESHGVRYSLFDDGTIEAETDSGAYSFASIEELRAFLDARKAARGA